MVAAVFDASAVLALLRDEPGADLVEPYVGRAAISAVNLQEVIKELLLQGLPLTAAREILTELRLEVRSHDEDAAYAAAALHELTKYGRGLGDRSCMALGLALEVPVVTADREWKRVKIADLKFVHLR